MQSDSLNEKRGIGVFSKICKAERRQSTAEGVPQNLGSPNLSLRISGRPPACVPHGRPPGKGIACHDAMLPCENHKSENLPRGFEVVAGGVVVADDPLPLLPGVE